MSSPIPIPTPTPIPIPIPRRAVLCAFLLAAAGRRVGAEPPARQVAADDARQVRVVIEAQLAAFADDDASRAFSYAASNIRDMFGTAELFMDMVRTGYPVVYRPALVVFLKPEWVGSELIQRVQLTDSKGALWSATYTMQRQQDQSWRIGGCEIVENEGHFT